MLTIVYGMIILYFYIRRQAINNFSFCYVSSLYAMLACVSLCYLVLSCVIVCYLVLSCVGLSIMDVIEGRDHGLSLSLPRSLFLFSSSLSFFLRVCIINLSVCLEQTVDTKPRQTICLCMTCFTLFD